ncbi:MAG: 6-bladed beta-propeller [Gemmatimonadaceae bacterium]|nr:6-bladed beta-propeller [Gemmatimonadaceae bacterium]
MMALVAVLLACGRESQDTSSSQAETRRDSAGIEIVTNDASAWREGSAWTLDTQPALTIAFDDRTNSGPTDVAGAVRLSNGNVVVASAQALRLEVYDRAGRFLRTIGRRGDGPGEFRAITRIWRMRGDSLLLFEGGMTRRFVAFDSAGRAGRTWGAFGADSAMHFLVPVAPLSNGDVAMRTMTVITPATQVRYERPFTTLVLFDATWQLSRRLGQFPDVGRYRGPGRMLAEAFFTADTRFAFGATQWVAGDSEHAEYLEYTNDGRLARIVRWRPLAVPVRPEHIEREQERRVAYFRSLFSNVPRLQRQFIDGGVRPLFVQMQYPLRFPEYSEIHVVGDGHVVLLDFPRIGEEETQQLALTVLSPVGRLLGRVVLPKRFRPLEIGSDYLLGVRTDDDDVPRVELWHLYRAR